VDLQNEFNKNLLQKNEENYRLKHLNQGLTEQIKKLKNEKLKKSLDLLSISKSQESQTIKVSKWVPQTSRIPYRHPNHISRYNQHQIKAETMTNAIEKSSKAQIQTSEKGSNANLVKVQKNNLIVTSLQASTENGSEKQLQKSLEAPKVEVLVNTSQAIRVPYRDPNHKSHYDRRKNQKENY